MVASCHLRKGERMLLALSNWTREATTVDVKLKTDALGFGDAPLAAEDAITRQPVAADGGVLSLDVKGDGFRLIEIHREDER